MIDGGQPGILLLSDEFPAERCWREVSRFDYYRAWRTLPEIKGRLSTWGVDLYSMTGDKVVGYVDAEERYWLRVEE